jgi:hypothetical protein
MNRDTDEQPPPDIDFDLEMPEESETQADLPVIIHLPDLSQSDHATEGGGTKRRKGRHFGPRPVDDPRSERVFLRVTPAQHAALQAAAQAAGLSVSGFICQRTLGDPGPRAHKGRAGPDRMLLAQVKAALGRCGGNLQQITRRLNSLDFSGIPELIAMREFVIDTVSEHRTAAALLLRVLLEPRGDE